MLFHNNKPKFGDCEASHPNGGGVNVKIALMNKMWLCEECIVKEKETEARNAASKKVIETARKTDSVLELKQDVFNASTVAFVERQAAIENNSEIPADRKNFALMTEIADLITKLDAAIFAEEQSTAVKRNERHALLVNAQNVAARLHEKEREKFKQYDINYKPVTPKSIKPKVVKPTTQAFNKKALYDAAKKYDVPAHNVQSLVTQRHMSYEDAAKHMAELLGKL